MMKSASNHAIVAGLHRSLTCQPNSTMRSCHKIESYLFWAQKLCQFKFQPDSFGDLCEPSFLIWMTIVRQSKNWRILKQKNAVKFTEYVLELVLNDFFCPVLFRIEMQCKSSTANRTYLSLVIIVIHYWRSK